MKKFFVGMTAMALMSTCFTVGAFAQEVNNIKVNKPVKVGAFQEQQGAEIQIEESEKDSWSDDISFELKLPGDAVWNKKTVVSKNFKTQFDGNTLKITGKADPKVKEKISVMPYFDIDRKANKGDLTVLIKSDMKKDEGETVKVAEISDYAVSLTSTYKKAPVNSKNVPVQLILTEDVENSIVGGVIYTISFDNATIDPKSFNIKSLKGFDEFKVRSIKDGYVELELDKSGGAKNKWQIDLEVTPKVGFAGEINAKIEGRGIDNDSTAVAKIYDAVNVENRKPDVLELGKLDQKISNVDIAETVAGGLSKGNYTLRLEPAYKGFEFTKASINITDGDMRVTSPSINGSEIKFRVKGDSIEKSTIQIGDMMANLDRYGYDGMYKLELVNDDRPDEVILSVDLFEVNPKDLSKQIKFVIGNKDYTIKQGESKKTGKLLAAPFISKDNKTMLPLRAIGEALDAEVKWDGVLKTITIKSTDDKTVLITLGNTNMIVDGKVVKMSSAAVAKEGTTFLPVRDVAEALNAKVDWNNQEKSATVTKK